MFCHVCGAEIQSGASFCPRCGATVSAGAAPAAPRPPRRPGGLGAGLGLRRAAPTPPRPGGSGTDALGIVEAALSVALAAAVALAPVVRVPILGSFTALGVVANLSMLNLQNIHGALGPALVALTVVACLCSLLNAKLALGSRGPGLDLSPLSLLVCAVPAYAAFLIVMLGAISRESYSLISATGWVWVFLAGGLACAGVHLARRKRRTYAQSGAVA